MVNLVWSELSPDDLDGIRELARVCLAADGGLPTMAADPSVRRFYDHTNGLVGRDATGDIVAVGAQVRDHGTHLTVTGLVDPSIRGAGVGEELLAWGRARNPLVPLHVTVENDSEASREFAYRTGLVRVFAEDIMRHDLGDIPVVPRDPALIAVPWGTDTRAAFHHVWRQSFGERPGFTDLDLDAWVAFVESDPEFLPADSRLVLDGGDAVAFVTVSRDWIEQLGVVPSRRGHGLGGHLMARSLTALRKLGRQEVWLAVAEENADAHRLYGSLGFVDVGVRARYVDATVSAD